MNSSLDIWTHQGALSCVSGFPDVVGVGSAGSKAAGSLGVK